MTKIKLTHLKLSIPLKTQHSLGWLQEVSADHAHPLHAEAEYSPEPVISCSLTTSLNQAASFLLKIKHLQLSARKQRSCRRRGEACIILRFTVIVQNDSWPGCNGEREASWGGRQRWQWWLVDPSREDPECCGQRGTPCDAWGRPRTST